MCAYNYHMCVCVCAVFIVHCASCWHITTIKWQHTHTHTRSGKSSFKIFISNFGLVLWLRSGIFAFGFYYFYSHCICVHSFHISISFVLLLFQCNVLICLLFCLLVVMWYRGGVAVQLLLFIMRMCVCGVCACECNIHTQKQKKELIITLCMQDVWCLKTIRTKLRHQQQQQQKNNFFRRF